nr:MAG TPA: hypothetical protein [Caudoviricetes sp.]
MHLLHFEDDSTPCWSELSIDELKEHLREEESSWYRKTFGKDAARNLFNNVEVILSYLDASSHTSDLQKAVCVVLFRSYFNKFKNYLSIFK